MNYYPSASTAAYGTSGTALTNGLHSIATVTQTLAALAFEDIAAVVSALPSQYWVAPSVAWHIHPSTILTIRNLKNSSNVPIYHEVHEPDGGVRAYMYGFPVIPNPYMDEVGSGKFPIYLAAWSQFLTIAAVKLSASRFLLDCIKPNSNSGFPRQKSKALLKLNFQRKSTPSRASSFGPNVRHV